MVLSATGKSSRETVTPLGNSIKRGPKSPGCERAAALSAQTPPQTVPLRQAPREDCSATPVPEVSCSTFRLIFFCFASHNIRPNYDNAE
jgi:hypothetical protein